MACLQLGEVPDIVLPETRVLLLYADVGQVRKPVWGGGGQFLRLMHGELAGYGLGVGVGCGVRSAGVGPFCLLPRSPVAKGPLSGELGTNTPVKAICLALAFR